MSALDIPPPIDHVRQHDVAAALRAFLPDYAVLFNAEDVKPYECDGLSAFRQVPMVVALPATEAEVQRVLQTCHRLHVPVVPRGAGTGLSGGALPLGNGVLLSLAKLMRIIEIDPSVQPLKPEELDDAQERALFALGSPSAIVNETAEVVAP